MTKTKKPRLPLFQCQECGKLYYTTKAAERAMNHRCTCGGCDIDLYVPKRRETR